MVTKASNVYTGCPKTECTVFDCQYLDLDKYVAMSSKEYSATSQCLNEFA